VTPRAGDAWLLHATRHGIAEGLHSWIFGGKLQIGRQTAIAVRWTPETTSVCREATLTKMESSRFLTANEKRAYMLKDRECTDLRDKVNVLMGKLARAEADLSEMKDHYTALELQRRNRLDATMEEHELTASKTEAANASGSLAAPSLRRQYSDIPAAVRTQAGQNSTRVKASDTMHAIPLKRSLSENVARARNASARRRRGEVLSALSSWKLKYEKKMARNNLFNNVAVTSTTEAAAERPKKPKKKKKKKAGNVSYKDMMAQITKPKRTESFEQRKMDQKMASLIGNGLGGGKFAKMKDRL